MRFSDEFLSELKYRNPIDEVVSSYVNLKQSGNLMKGLCPFHNEKTPSFTVYPQNGSYYCFGCQNGGSVIEFVRNIENLDFAEAVRFLAERSGLPMPDNGYDDSAEKLRRTLLEINRETARFYFDSLKGASGGKALQYLIGRGLKPETIAHFGLGYAPENGFALCNHLKSKGFSETDMILANVCGQGRSGRPYDRFRNKVMFPIIDLRGNVIAFGGRKLPGEEGAKYINTSDTPVYKKSRNMYALNFAKNNKADKLIICEGYMDVISLHQAGFTNAVAALGTSFTEEQASLLSRYTKQVIVSMDSDEAGQKSARRIIGILDKTGIQVKVLQIEGGKDPDEFIKAYGAERFRLLLEDAKADTEFRLLSAKTKYNMDSDGGRVQYLSEAVDILSTVSSEIAVNLYAGKLAIELSVDKPVLLRQIQNKRKYITKNFVKNKLREATTPRITIGDVNAKAREHPRAAVAEETILSVIMNNPELYSKAFDNLYESDFITDFNRSVFTALKQSLTAGRDFDISVLSGEFTTEQMSRITSIYLTRNVGELQEITLFDCIKVLREESAKLDKIDAASLDNDDFDAAIKSIGQGKRPDNRKDK